MGYLVAQMILYLVIAAVIGFVVGWLLRGLMRPERAVEADAAAAAPAAPAPAAGAPEPAAVAAAPEALALGKIDYDIVDIEGIGKVYRERLRGLGIETTEKLLELCAAAEGRQQLADRLELPLRTIRDWVSMADLMRLSGVATQFSELLQASGVDSVQELATQDAEELARRLAEVNEKGKLTRTVPNAEKVAAWIEEAGTLRKFLRD